jgi:hypothetical protein
MKKKIESLTPEQEVLMQETLAKWLKIGRRTEPLNRDKVKSIIGQFYSRIGEKEPMIFYFDSPMTCMMAYGVLRGLKFDGRDNLRDNLWANLWANLWDNLRANLGANLWDNLGDNLGANLRDNLRANLWANLRANLWDNLGDNLRDNLWANLRANLWDNLGDNLRDNLWANLRANLQNSWWGNQDAAWKVFYDFGNKIGCKFTDEDRSLLDLWLDESEELHWWFPYKGIVLVSEHPNVLKVNSQGKLHSENSMAIGYNDGWGIYSLNGVTMKESHVMTHSSKIDFNDILKETNVEVRRELLRKVGIEAMLDKLPHRQMDSVGEYRLLSIDLSDDLKDCRYLKMLNPSIGCFHLEGVSRDCSTVQDALNWRAGDIKKTWQPCELT